MTKLSDTVPAWVAPYIGIDFKDRGRDREGLDCWGLVRLVYAERFGVALPSLEYSSVEDGESVAAAVSAERGDWELAAEPQVGDVVMAKMPKCWHAGVLVARDRMLNAREGTQTCVDRINTPLWRPRVKEILRYAGRVRVGGFDRPLTGGRVNVALPAGHTVAELLALAGVQDTRLLRVWVGESELPRGLWANVRPKAGRSVTVAAIPEGGGGKDALRIVLSIAVIAAAIAIPGSIAAFAAVGGGLTIGGQLVGAGIAIVGALAVNALLPAAKPRLSEGSAAETSPTVTGSRNEARQWGTVPVVFGTHRIAPLYGAAPYTEVVGDDQYLRLLFVPGYGELELTDHRIGETAIEEYEGVELEVQSGAVEQGALRLYPGTVLEDSLSLLLKQEESWVQRTTRTGATEISVDITAPSGVAVINRDGSRGMRTVELEVEYSPTGLNAWTPINGASPSVDRGLDLLFREPEATRGGSGNHPGRIAWGAALPDAKPSYLPARNYSWKVEGFIHAATAGVYRFGLDGSDAMDLTIRGAKVVEWLGQHEPLGGNFDAHSGEITLSAGWHPITLRMESRSVNGGAIALAWQTPGVEEWDLVPAEALFRRGAFAVASQRLRYTWFDTSVYGGLSIRADRTESIRKNISWAVPAGQYDVRVRRLTPDATTDSIIDQVFWTALRTIRSEDPVKLGGLCRVGLRIKATDQLQGVVDNYNCVATSILPDWDRVSRTWVLRATSNPASCYRAILQGRANARPLGDHRIDLEELQAWHEECEDNGFTCNVVFDTRSTIFERLSDIAVCGRGAFGMRDGKYSVVRDKPQTTPTQHFTPRNSWGFAFSKSFPDLPHGLRIRFLNAENNYENDERIVLDDGYQLEGLDAFDRPAPSLPPATKFESLQALGMTDPEQIWSYGRYIIASTRLRPATYELSADIEHLACTRGDLVLVTHDVPQWGLGFGRIARVVKDSDGNLRQLVVDEPVIMDAGEQYTLRARLSDGSTWIKSIVTAEGQNQVLTLAQPIAAGEPQPAKGDLFMFGRVGQETRELIVKSIDVSEDLSAKLTLVDHAPAVHLADEGEIPPFDPGISLPPTWANRPETPVISSIRSDDLVMIRDADGSLRARMLITLQPQSGRRPIATLAQVRYRPKPASGEPAAGQYSYTPQLPLQANQLSVENVQEGITYELLVRTLTATGQASEWVSAEHTVIGKSAPPPDLVAFDVVRLSDGTRSYSWAYGLVPPDIAGAVIRYGTAEMSWEQMTPVHEGVLQASPAELNEPGAGTWKFAAKAIDTSGNVSVNALFVTRTLGPQRLEGVAFADDAGVNGWPGLKVQCHVTAEGTLEADDLTTWDTLASLGAGTWATWMRWIQAPASPIRYESTVLDAGFEFLWTPDAIVNGQGVITCELAWSSDGVTWSAWTPLLQARGASVLARYLKARVFAESTAGMPIPVISSLLVMMRAAARVHELQDLSTSTLAGVYREGVGDIRLPVPAALFSVVRSVAVTFNGQGPGWSWELVDKNASIGPRVRLYNAAGQRADALIDAVIRGL